MMHAFPYGEFVCSIGYLYLLASDSVASSSSLTSSSSGFLLPLVASMLRLVTDLQDFHGYGRSNGDSRTLLGHRYIYDYTML